MATRSTVLEGVAFLTVTGDIDIATGDELRATGINAISEYSATLRTDLSGVTFIDSTGISALIAIRNRAESTNVVLILEPVPAKVQRVLDLTGLTSVFQIK